MRVATAAHRVVFEQRRDGGAQVTVCLPLYNYRDVVTVALDSVAAQLLPSLDLVVVEDASDDDSLAVARDWLERHADRFRRALLLAHDANAGLSAARNTGFLAAETPFVLPLDADNLLYPRFTARCLEALERSDAVFAYPILRVFGGREGLLGTDSWSRGRLAQGNYIDAMAMIRREAWLEVGGYSKAMHMGWEDYDLWCKFVEAGYRGLQVPEVLGAYRVHSESMIHTKTNLDGAALARRAIQRRHPWLAVGLSD